MVAHGIATPDRCFTSLSVDAGDVKRALETRFGLGELAGTLKELESRLKP